jgi:hypothetical protein
MIQPNYPLVIINRNHAIHVFLTEVDLSKPTAFEAIRQTDREIAFDINGSKWTYRLTTSRTEESIIKRFVDYILYNPVIEVKPEWTAQGNYQLGELKELITNYVNKGNITVLMNLDAFDKDISQASSFEDIYTILKEYDLVANASELWNEQEHKR